MRFATLCAAVSFVTCVSVTSSNLSIAFITPAAEPPQDFAAVRGHGLLMRRDEPRVGFRRLETSTTSIPMNAAERPGKVLP